MAPLRQLLRPSRAAPRAWVARSGGTPSSTAWCNSSTLVRPSRHGDSSFPKPIAGVAISIALSLAITAYSIARSPIDLDAPSQHGAASLLPSVQLSEEDFHIDPATSQRLPRKIKAPVSLASGVGPDEPLVLLASGVRTVSFLRVQVYVAALYVLEEPFEEFMRNHQRAAGGSQRQDESLEQTMRHALEAGVPMVLKIVPVKNTDFGHLRDGFTRAVQARQNLLRKASTPPSEEQEEFLSLSLQKLKECFPKASLKKGEHLDLVFQPNRITSPSAGASADKGVDLAFEHERVVLGTVQYDSKGGNVDVARLLFQAYVADKNPVSEVFKNAVSHRIFPAGLSP